MKNLREKYPYEFSLIPPKDLAHNILGISVSTLYERMKDSDFPKKVKLSPGRVGFRRADIEDYIQSKMESS